jgi:cell wall-associated NlpC family hydrolase
VTEAEARTALVAEALSWEATPYHERARIKGVGVDCAQFPAAVYEAVGLIPHIEPDYCAQWMLHRDEERFLAWVLPHAREIGRELLGPGDFGIWKFGRTFSHGAIVIDPPVVIHAVIRGGGVIRGDMDRDIELATRAARFFTLFGGKDGAR